MEKDTPPEILTPVNVRKSETVEESLGISDARFTHLGFIMDDIFSKKTTKAEALLAIANNATLSDIEKTYLGYKLHERIVNITITNSVPSIFGGIIKKRLR